MWKWRSFVCLVLSAATLPAALDAQAGAAPPTPPLVLPLSGRTGEPGAVVNVQGAYEGSVVPKGSAGASLELTLADTVRRGLEYNLGTVGYQNATTQARAQRQQALSELLPNITSYALLTEQQVDLAAFGFSFKIPGFSAPTGRSITSTYARS